jgi:two-component system response regulator
MNPDSLQRCVILAVDDEDDDIELMQFLFRKAGITLPVEVFRSGEDLIDVLTAVLAKPGEPALPLLCFLDVKMPSINGHELLRWIRTHPQLDGIAVVMLSSSEHPVDVKQAAEGGAQCYLAKYPQPETLKRVLAEAEHRSSRGAAARKEWFRLPDNLLLRYGDGETEG